MDIDLLSTAAKKKTNHSDVLWDFFSRLLVAIRVENFQGTTCHAFYHNIYLL